MTDELVAAITALTKEMRLSRVETTKTTVAMTQLTAVMKTMENDLRSVRGKVDIIEARVPYPGRKKAVGA